MRNPPRCLAAPEQGPDEAEAAEEREERGPAKGLDDAGGKVKADHRAEVLEGGVRDEYLFFFFKKKIII